MQHTDNYNTAQSGQFKQASSPKWLSVPLRLK